jgi:NAD(P)-dependent dehydrogenase (short-subunit alcohol dehydrogenase family)
MKDKIVLVTGANGGLGSSVTQAFLDAGAIVIGASRNIRQSEFDSATFTAISADLSSGQGARELIEELLSKFGRLDVLAYTVGGFAGGSAIADTDDPTFQNMFDVNLYSTFYLLRAAIPALRQSQAGRVIAIGSRAAVDPGANVGAYSASKAAMVSLIRTVALENQDVGMTANIILPGTIDTAANRKAMPKADFSKWVQPKSIASLMVWLASEAGKDVNGAAIPVYGSA